MNFLFSHVLNVNNPWNQCFSSLPLYMYVHISISCVFLINTDEPLSCI